MARNANPLALVAAAQHYPDDYSQAPKLYTSRDGESIESYCIRFYRMMNEMTNLRTSSNTKLKNVDTSPRTGNDRQTVSLRIRGQEQLLGTCTLHVQIQEVLHPTDDTSGPTYDTEPLEKGVDQNAEEPEDERVLFASLIANLKLDVDENKMIQKQLKKANMSVTKELDKNKHALKEVRKHLSQKDCCPISKDFSKIEAHCVALEPEYQNQALKSGQHGRVLKVIDAIETINIELEHSMAKLFQENENLHKENEHLKQTYKDIFDSIKLTKTQTKVNNDSLIVQLNKKSIENADLKAQLRDKTNVNVEMRNLLNKMKGKSVDTKFEKPSVVRQPNAFRFQKPSVMGKLTKKPKVVPISTRKPTKNANQYVVTPHKITVASETAISKSKSYFRMLYDKTSKAWTWWIEKQCPSGYIWKPKVKNDNALTSDNLHLDNESRDRQRNDLLTGTRGSDLYTIALQESSLPTLICFMAKASPTQAWLWHLRLSHLNFKTINLISKNDIVNGLPKLEYIKDQLDLCGPMRVESINERKYILVIVDDYSRYTWTHFLRSKDETPSVLIDFIKMIQRGLQAQVINVRTGKGT
ncbi:retrovirus-related pol polyprotein from transposon TNT 1-94 [Tanacetum coccineum]